MFFYYGLENSPTYLKNADFRNFIIDGSESNGGTYDSSGKGFMLLLVEDCDYENVIVRNTDATGFGIDCPINCTIKDCQAINCGKTAKADSYGASGFGIGIGYSEDEYMIISGCTANGNKKFGFFFEHQGRFKDEKGNTKYNAKSSKGFVAQNCIASGNQYDFGGARGNDITYENCKSNNEYSKDGVEHKYSFYFENYSKRIHLVNCKTEDKFSDVGVEDAYYEAVCWGINNGITLGSGKSFQPDVIYKKQEIVLLLYRMNERPGEANIKETKMKTEEIDEAKDWWKSTFKGKDSYCEEENCTLEDFIEMLEICEGQEISNVIKKDYEDYELEKECSRAKVLTILYNLYKTKGVTYSINYNLNGGSFENEDQKTSYISGKESFTLKTPVKEGYTFVGWTGSNNSERVQKNVAITAEDTGNKNYTANWIPNIYTIIFNGNGGKICIEKDGKKYYAEEVFSEYLVENQYPLLAVEFKKDDYEFLNWNDQKDGRGVSFSNGEKIGMVQNSTETLYAQWKHINHTEIIDEAIEATCTTAGKTEGKHCSVCGEILANQEIIKAKGHDYRETVTEPTTTTRRIYDTHVYSMRKQL